MDKKKSPFDTSSFNSEIVKDIPQQMNGSDCGMFTCKVYIMFDNLAGVQFFYNYEKILAIFVIMFYFLFQFAEYLSRDAPISFSQEDMPYYRRRMIYEIVKNNLMYP